MTQIIKTDAYKDTRIETWLRGISPSASWPFRELNIVDWTSSPTQTVIVTLQAPAGLQPGSVYDPTSDINNILRFDSYPSMTTYIDHSGDDPNAILDRLMYSGPVYNPTYASYDITATVSYSLDAVGKTIEATSDPVIIHWEDNGPFPSKYSEYDSTPMPTPTPAPTPEPEQSAAPVPQPEPVSAPVPEPEPTSAANFAVDNNGVGSSMAGVAYTGPVAGLDYELSMITADSLAISAIAPNAFIVTGSGNDAISVASSGGRNVLDGGTGSNFLTGGSGADTFFLDNRGPAAPIWSTITNLQSGDAATVWGLTPDDFAMSWADGQGAAGNEGLTLHATAAGRPNASLTLGGYSTADLSNGRLAMTFGANGGGDYLYIHAV